MQFRGNKFHGSLFENELLITSLVNFNQKPVEEENRSETVSGENEQITCDQKKKNNYIYLIRRTGFLTTGPTYFFKMNYHGSKTWRQLQE